MKIIGIELGSSNTKIYVKRKGVFYHNATAIAFLKNEEKVLAIGHKAEKLVGKAPPDVEAVFPIEEGVIKNYKATLLFLNHLINKCLGFFKFLKPEIILSIPVELNSVELKGFTEIFEEIKIKKLYLIKEPILSAIGAKLNLNDARSHLIINLGGGKCDIGIISLGGLVAQKLIKLGSDDITLAIKEYIENFYEIKIDSSTAKTIRNQLLNLVINKRAEEEIMEIKGQDAHKNISRTITVKSAEIRNVALPYINEIINGIKDILKIAPSESIGDFLDKGVYLTGGGAYIKNLDLYIFEEIGLKPIIPEKPEICVLNGLKFVVDNLDIYKQMLRLK